MSSKHRAKAIMFVGTSSNSGKSLFTAAMCRILHEKGLNVAPFKAQNMSLNSFVTKESGEIGRAQAFQARCAGIEPHTDMNPILLKPSGDSKSQVIVNGKVYKTLSAMDYYKVNKYVREKAFEAYDRLAENFDFIILEGAGSPTEINLLHRDFVNMVMADYASANVFLIADIDRGGVFASIYGTIKLLPKKYQKLFKGIIINKFRGDEKLLKNGIEKIEQLTGVKVIGIMPYVNNLKIEEEDSLGLEQKCKAVSKKQNSFIDIAVIKYPRISNYTDFLIFEKIQECSVRYISETKQLGSPDIIFLPGSKNTRADLEFLTKSGLKNEIIKLYKNGTPVFGICGGFQMLGCEINDPNGIEYSPGKSKGLSLLPIYTTMEKEKTLKQVSGTIISNLPFAEKGTQFKAYEIHMGTTIPKKNHTPILSCENRKSQKILACISDDKLAFGTYMHGFFDNPQIAHGLIKWLDEKKGIKISKLNPIESNDSFELFCSIFRRRIFKKIFSTN